MLIHRQISVSRKLLRRICDISNNISWNDGVKSLPIVNCFKFYREKTTELRVNEEAVHRNGESLTVDFRASNKMTTITSNRTTKHINVVYYRDGEEKIEEL